MKTLVYTFRTTSFKDKLQETFPNLFVFGKLNEDLTVFSHKVIAEKPDFVIGIANTNDFSRFERVAINQFNKTKKVSSKGVQEFELFVPKNSFKKSGSPTDSFCNWTAYKIAEFVKNNKLKTNVSFVHLKEEDLNICF